VTKTYYFSEMRTREQKLGHTPQSSSALPLKVNRGETAKPNHQRKENHPEASSPISSGADTKKGWGRDTESKNKGLFFSISKKKTKKTREKEEKEKKVKPGRRTPEKGCKKKNQGWGSESQKVLWGSSDTRS